VVQRPKLTSVTLSSPPTVARLWLGRHECFNADSVHPWWAGGFILAAAAIYTDPRPFVVDLSIKPLFAHPADNGFPSDHTALAATVALVVMMYRRWLGAALLAAGIVLGAARVAAHVHHVPDIAAGVLIALLAVGAASVIWRYVRPHLPSSLSRSGFHGPGGGGH
jgi:membrane-associated phospholipid phosphatase